MIKIRYADLPAGLHIRAVARGKDTVIYLLPGLTAAQRQAALRRARSSARMGHGPRLPVPGVLGAVMVDRMRTTVRNGAAAMRGHPAILVPPLVIVMSAAVAYILLVSVDIRIHDPQANGPAGPGTPIAAAVAPPGGSADDPGAQPGSASRNTSGHSQRPTHKRSGGSQRRLAVPVTHAVSRQVNVGPEPEPVAVGRRIADPDGGRRQLDGFRLGLARCRRGVRGSRPAGRVPVAVASAGPRKSVQDGSAHLRSIWQQA